jgi:hypothetical protein
MRATELLHADADPNLSFLFRNQLLEADLICFTKSDLYVDHPSMSPQQVRHISARTGQGVAAWLNEILSGDLRTASKILDIDYAQYARAEAALVWLDLQVNIEPRIPRSPAMVLGPLLDHLDAEFTRNNISILHLKAIVDSPAGFVKAAICGNGQEPAVEGVLDASPASKHDLTLNLRALGEAVRVREIVEQELERTDGELIGLHLDCFHPAAPKPERRAAKAR